MIYTKFLAEDFINEQNASLFAKCDGVCFFYYFKKTKVAISKKNESALREAISVKDQNRFEKYLSIDELDRTTYRQMLSELKTIKLKKKLLKKFKKQWKELNIPYLGGCFYRFDDMDNLELLQTGEGTQRIRSIEEEPTDMLRNIDPELLAPIHFVRGQLEGDTNLYGDQFFRNDPPFGLVFFSKQEVGFYLNFNAALDVASAASAASAASVASVASVASDGIRLVSSFMELPWNITNAESSTGELLARDSFYTTLAIMPYLEEHAFARSIMGNNNGYEIPGASMRVDLSYRLGASCPPSWRPTIQGANGVCRIVNNLKEFYLKINNTYDIGGFPEKIKKYTFD